MPTPPEGRVTRQRRPPRACLRPLPGDEAHEPNRRAGEQTDLATRLWSKVNGPWYGDVDHDACWLWMGAAETGPFRVLPDGSRVKRQKRFRYGRIRNELGELEGVHRVAYRLTFGEIPDGLVVMHSRCDVTLCANPWHMKAGTQADNVAEMYAKGRHRCGATGPLPEEQRWAS